jgi:large subunit ribosomal protein L6
MSRIGKLPIAIPSGVKVAADGGMVRVEGPKGKLQTAIPGGIEVRISDDTVRVERGSDHRKVRALHGLTRKLIANMTQGVSQGFSRVLEINGVGYRAEVKGQAIHVTLGFSHPVVFPLPSGVTAAVERQTIVTLSSSDRHLLGETAAKFRALRPPEPYKGKGVKYREEIIRRKAGKAVGSAGGA